MVVIAKKTDSTVLAELALQLWNDNTLGSLKNDFEKLADDENSVCFLKYADQKPVGYLEGIFILEAYRHRGYAKELLRYCEKWAKEKHCAEFASDCELGNTDSFGFHMAMGFEEANRIICFRKQI